MYIYDCELKDKTRYLFYTDGAETPEEVKKFFNENQEELNEFGCFCDHFSATLKEWFCGKIPKEKVNKQTEILEDGTYRTTYKVICKGKKKRNHKKVNDRKVSSNNVCNSER